MKKLLSLLCLAMCLLSSLSAVAQDDNASSHQGRHDQDHQNRHDRQEARRQERQAFREHLKQLSPEERQQARQQRREAFEQRLSQLPQERQEKIRSRMQARQELRQGRRHDPPGHRPFSERNQGTGRRDPEAFHPASSHSD